MSRRYSIDGLLNIAVAREINDFENVVIGIGIPITTCVLVKGWHTKNAVLKTESGLIGFDPLIPLIGIADVEAPSGEELEFARRINLAQSIGKKITVRFINKIRYPKFTDKGNAFIDELRSKFFS